MANIKIIDTNIDNIQEYGVCGYKNIKMEGYRRKLEWLKMRFKEGMKIKMILSETHGAQGMIEYIPGEFCWRVVDAKEYMFIHCIFLGFKKEYKGKGYGTLLIKECLKDAKQQKMKGVAVVTRKGTWMAGKEVFLKNGFKSVDTAPPDFELLEYKFDQNSPSSKFMGDWEKRAEQYNNGLYIFVSDQCPYIGKALPEMIETAEKIYKIKPNIIEFKNHKQAQKSPNIFGSFCVVYNGKVVADNPISNTRFKNILDKILK